MSGRSRRLYDLFDRAVMRLIEMVCGSLLALMVLFTVYTVFMRYVFNNPPFWGDTLTLFCNIWFVLLAYAISARKRDYIAMQGLYAVLPARWGATLNFLWDALTVAFGLFLVGYGYVAARTVPGEFWELGGLPMEVPLMIMPIAGGCMALAAVRNVAADLARLRGGGGAESKLTVSGEGV